MSSLRDQAFAEAMAAPRASQTSLETLELWHSAWTNPQGDTQPIRLVADVLDQMLGIENDAPFNPGETVLFQAFAFRATSATQDEGEFDGEMTIEVDNVARALMPFLDQIAGFADAVQMRVREYDGAKLWTPARVEGGLELVNIKMSGSRVTATGRRSDLSAAEFPRDRYGLENYGALANIYR